MTDDFRITYGNIYVCAAHYAKLKPEMVQA